MSAFCREHGLCEQTFYYWRKRLRRAAEVPAVKAGFAEVAVEPVGVSPNIIVHLNTGILLELPVGADPSWVGRLVGELEGALKPWLRSAAAGSKSSSPRGSPISGEASAFRP